MLKIADNQIIILVCMSSFTHHSYRNFNVLQYSEILCTAKVVIFPQYPMHHYVKNHFYSYDYPSGSINSGNWVQDAWQRMERVSTHSNISTGKKVGKEYPLSVFLLLPKCFILPVAWESHRSSIYFRIFGK